MGEELRIDDSVIHNGITKIIKEIHGEVLILDDKSVVSSSNVSLDMPSREEENAVNEELANTRTVEKEALRQRLEDISENTLATEIIITIREVDPNFSVTAANLEDMEGLKQILIRKALQLRKIDSKMCESCGQVIPE